MTALAWALVLGSVLGFGVWTLVSLVPRMGAPRLSTRVAPYLVDVSDEARALMDRPSSDPAAAVWGLVSPLLGRMLHDGLSLLSSNATVALRLSQSGSRGEVTDYRRRQLLAAVTGFAAGASVAAGSVLTGAGHSAVVALLPVLAGGAGAVACDVVLLRRARRRLRRLEEELPTVLGFLSLSLSAGEGILDALRRVSTIGSGEFSVECRRVVADVGSGVALSRALQDMSNRLALPAVTRLVEQLSGALERGSPLAETLRAHASDARLDAKRRLLEAAGRKEVAMLVPLVFLILPLSVAFAILPGLLVLRAGF